MAVTRRFLLLCCRRRRLLNLRACFNSSSSSPPRRGTNHVNKWWCLQLRPMALIHSLSLRVEYLRSFE
ncbi:hypothetical protein JOB18_049723 [Solea senegalensis]|uniref:Uncharacterized protein n=1 Tax=Solea senegalensis TaxID=28829 RepID=A0AAV6PJW4_SOLSE|nr:hypothetical protein JOB18_049723 [Solea senegalensis]